MKPSTNPDSRLLPGLLGLSWLALITILYFVSHKPFGPEQAFGFTRGLYQIMVASGLMALAGGLGLRVSRIVSWRVGSEGVSSRLETAVLQAAIGLGVLSLGVLLVGVTLGFSIWLSWIAFGLLLLWLWKDSLNWGCGILELVEIWGLSGRLGRFLFTLSALILLSGIPVALSPPLGFDALVYHLALPQTYLLTGQFYYTPWNIFWGMPQLAEMLYTWTMSLAGAESAAILGWLVALLALLGVVGYTNRRLGARPAAVALASLLAGLTLAQSTAWAYVDYWALFFAAAFLIHFDYALQESTAKSYFWSGVFAGLAFSSKYTSGILVLCALLALLWGTAGNWTLRERFRRAGIFLLGTVLPALPWLIKNLLSTGNPFYPLLFPSGEMNSTRLNFYQGGQAWGDWTDLFVLPFRATYVGWNHSPGYGASIGPLLLGLGLIALWAAYKGVNIRHGIRTAAFVAIPGLLIWAVLGRISYYLLQTRLYLALFPAFAVLAGGGFAFLARQNIPGLRLGRVAGGLVAFVLGLSLLESGLHVIQLEALPYLAGFTDRQAYLENNLGWYARAVDTVNGLPDSASVLLLFEPRNLYCLPDCYPDEILDRWLADMDRLGDSQAVLASWKERGYSHVLYYKVGAEFLRYQDQRFSNLDWTSLDILLDRLPMVEDFGEAYILYELTP